MSKIKQYDKGFSAPALQRKYNLTYVQGVYLADYIQGLKELLKECRDELDEYDSYTEFNEVGRYKLITKIDEVLNVAKD